ncbi:MAG: hypothetical protein ABFS32_18325 [Bacteroidota bacterium]
MTKILAKYVPENSELTGSGCITAIQDNLVSWSNRPKGPIGRYYQEYNLVKKAAISKL